MTLLLSQPSRISVQNLKIGKFQPVPDLLVARQGSQIINQAPERFWEPIGCFPSAWTREMMKNHSYNSLQKKIPYKKSLKNLFKNHLRPVVIQLIFINTKHNLIKRVQYMWLFNSVLKNETRPKGYIQIESKFEVSFGVCFIPSSLQVRALQCCWRVQLLLSFY